MHIISGTLIDISGHGVLLQGPSGAGKSMLALLLVDRGHRLIADDAVWLEKEEDSLFGHCPPLIQDFIAIKELGMINARKLLGEKSISSKIKLSLVINLEKKSHQVHDQTEIISLLNIDLPILFVAPFAPPILIEVAVQNFLLKNEGYCALNEFEQRRQSISTHEQAKIL